jgi:single-strand selective monofunctional uracil DNA glycosylase
MSEDTVSRLIEAARALSAGVGGLSFGLPVSHVYNPLEYAWEPHQEYLTRFARGRKRVVFVGMNPGPWGMAQTGVPFGEVKAVRDWMGIDGRVQPPARTHPARPVLGFDCPRSEPSGRRLWGLMKSRFGSADAFFQEHMVINYCPLLFIDADGANRVPEKLKPGEQQSLFAVCDGHLRAVIDTLEPEWMIGVGKFAEDRIRGVQNEGGRFRIGRVLHPSPANPLTRLGWAEPATEQLKRLGVWE